MSSPILQSTSVKSTVDKAYKSLTWDEANFSWDSAQGTWDNPNIPPTGISQSSDTISTVTKSPNS